MPQFPQLHNESSSTHLTGLLGGVKELVGVRSFAPDPRMGTWRVW